MWGGFDSDIESIFEDFAKDFGNLESFLPRLFKETSNANLKISPRMDLSGTDKEYIIEADLPGVKEEDLDMSISKDGVLSIKGKRESREENKELNYYRLERSYGSFERSIVLPDDCHSDKVAATFKNGILTIKMPKKEPVAGETKKITLS